MRKLVDTVVLVERIGPSNRLLAAGVLDEGGIRANMEDIVKLILYSAHSVQHECRQLSAINCSKLVINVHKIRVVQTM